MKKEPKFFLGHILESINDIEKYLEGVSEVQFSRYNQIQDAVVRRLEIIGEATKNLPESFTVRYPEVRWQEIAGMRDKLTHHYFGINMGIVWDTVKKDLPKLKKQVENIMEKE